MANVPDHLKAHRELEYLRTSAISANLRKKRKGKKKLSKVEKEQERLARKKVKERYSKLREVDF